MFLIFTDLIVKANFPKPPTKSFFRRKIWLVPNATKSYEQNSSVCLYCLTQIFVQVKEFKQIGSKKA